MHILAGLVKANENNIDKTMNDDINFLNIFLLTFLFNFFKYENILRLNFAFSYFCFFLFEFIKFEKMVTRPIKTY